MPWSPSFSQLLPSHSRRNASSMFSATDPLARGSSCFKSSLLSAHCTVAPITTTSSAYRVPVTSLTASPVLEQVHLPPTKPIQQPPPPSKSDERPADSISHLREAIHKLDSTMASLMSQRKELQFHLDKAVRSQSPVQRLPSELLSSIFLTGACPREAEDPLMVSCLMLVCRHWAAVALDTPALWSSIAVSKHHSLRRARRRLERSKSAPLDLAINFGPGAERADGVMETVIHAMDLFRPALWRTRTFRLSVATRAQAHAVLVRCREDAPLLECVSIRIFHSIQDELYSRAPLPLFNGCTPNLRSCSFTSFNFGWDTRTLVRLRDLELGGYFNGISPSVDTLLSILQESPDLSSFTLRDMSDVDPDCKLSDDYRMPTRRALVLPRLSRVAFECAGIIRTRLLLAQVSFPALRTLELSFLGNITPVLHHLETQALTLLPLQHLKIEACLFNELKLVQLLRRLPSLSRLELVDDEDVSANLVNSLSKPAADQFWVCPNLESISLEGCTSLESDALRTLVESRLPAPRKTHGSPRRVRVLDVSRCHQISKEMVQWLKMYVDEVRCAPLNGVWALA